ncbi:hypothetical protein BDV24DRAFT_177522 [Aspergillus arachidicola]|uniref:Zn(2)-C6 fungal-type domain-containing protein n=1 Tax=Aspergillus arachidicola TaxID=656916 RepID=A0A5N6XWC9_9EURO|nr:hypothetical protein BDV24DRAFT_177522 [Aspergillus arachidicola]
MSLKRGLERESCDFCFRRKIKCDRASRAREGKGTCSQCDLRQNPCTLDSDDVRIHRRCRMSPNSAELEGNTRASILPKSSLNDGGRFTQPLDGNTSLLPSPQTTMASNPTPDANINFPLHASTSESWADLEFELSSQSISFLNEVFVQECNPSESMVNLDDLSDPSLQPGSDSTEGATANQSPYKIQGIDFSTLEAALAAYFDFAALVLPIIHRDAFMADYENHQSSSALIFAVACRGCPFLHVSDKWNLQQQFASGFRLAFLQALNVAPAQKTIRLDDIEALALMVGFAYESGGDIPAQLHSQLETLFLTHESLVLMTLQYQIQCPPTLERTAERKALLLWHVYGLDAFYCLDRGVMSRIQEDDIEDVKPTESFTGHETGSYLDTMLSLAATARRITRTICSPRAKRGGEIHARLDYGSQQTSTLTLRSEKEIVNSRA